MRSLVVTAMLMIAIVAPVNDPCIMCGADTTWPGMYCSDHEPMLCAQPMPPIWENSAPPDERWSIP